MQQTSVAPLQLWEDSQLVQVHNLGFKDHIVRYGQFSELRGINANDVENWRKMRFFDAKGLLKAEADGIVGYSFAKVERVLNEKREVFLAGYLKSIGDSCSLICVLPSWRRKGVGSALLKNSELFIQSKGLKFIVAWAYRSDGIAKEFLRKAGYKHLEKFFVKEFSHVLPLNADVEFWKKDLTKPISFGDTKMRQVYSVRRHQKGDEANYAKVYNAVWGQYGQTITLEHVKRILSDPERDQVLFIETKGEVVGSAYFDHDGSVHLVGVIPEQRGKGVGKLLLTKTFECMQSRGYEVAYVSTSVVLRGAVASYQKLQCTRVDTLLCMVKTFV